MPVGAHASRPWRIHEVAPDFELVDVWALPTPGGPQDFPRLVGLALSLDPSKSPSRAVRALFEIRWRIGGLLGWDSREAGLGSRVASLRERLPADLREATSVPPPPELPFTPLYLTEDEFAAEIANRTVHGVLHLGWVPNGTGGWRGQMAVLVKRNGFLGSAYLAAIEPFRRLVVYPKLMNEIERKWQAGARAHSVAAGMQPRGAA
jgi:hypothetical protein